MPSNTSKESQPQKSKILDHLPALCNQIRRVAIEAGELTLEFFDEGGYQGTDVKGDGSPVTLADQKAEELIEKALKQITPEVLIVGEEAAGSRGGGGRLAGGLLPAG